MPRLLWGFGEDEMLTFERWERDGRIGFEGHGPEGWEDVVVFSAGALGWGCEQQVERSALWDALAAMTPEQRVDATCHPVITT